MSDLTDEKALDFADDEFRALEPFEALQEFDEWAPTGGKLWDTISPFVVGSRVGDFTSLQFRRRKNG